MLSLPCGKVTRNGVGDDSSLCRLGKLHTLSKQCAQHTCQYISHTAAGHTGVAMGADPNGLALLTNQSAKTLENANRIPFLGELPHSEKTILSDLSR